MISVSSLQSGGSAIGIIYAIFASVTLGLYFVLLRLASKYEGVDPDMMPCNVIACFFSAIGPSLIPASEVSLYMLIETVLGPVWVYLAGYQTPSKFTIYGGIILLLALGTNSLLALREEETIDIKEGVILEDVETIIDNNIIDETKESVIHVIEMNNMV
eukprot:gene16967-22462_t